MFQSIKDGLHQIFTEPNNHTLCPVRIIGIFATIQGIGMSAFVVIVRNAAFDLTVYGAGVGILLTALGAALGMKKDTKDESHP